MRSSRVSIMDKSTLCLFLILAFVNAGCKKDDAVSPAFDQKGAVEQLNNSIAGQWKNINLNAYPCLLPVLFTLQKTSFDGGVYTSESIRSVYGIVFSPDWPEKSNDPKFGIMLMDSNTKAIIQTMNINYIKGDTLTLGSWETTSIYKRVR